MTGLYGTPNGTLKALTGGVVGVGVTNTTSVNVLQIDATSALEVRSNDTGVVGRITTVIFISPTGFKVNLPDKQVAGQYTIMNVGYTDGSSGFGKIPTVGINNSNLTPSFAWSSSNLIMTLT